MQTKSVLYAAVGAPVVAVRKVSGVVNDQVSTLKGKVGEEKANYSKVASKAIDGWAVEGEKIVSQVSEKKVVEEISSKVDLDQAKEQVGKLRDQLEDMLATWKTSFRPEKDGKKVDEKAASKASTAKPSAKTTASKTAASKTPAKKTPAKEAAAKEAAATKAAATKAAATKAAATKATATKAAATKAPEAS